MHRFIRDDLHCGSLVVGTACNNSPFAIQAEMDVTDWHNYWEHPHFPGRSWDPVNWTVRNVPMAGVPDGGTLRMLVTRAAGKPLICTEYNHSAPNTYSSEAFLLLGAYAALHDLDGIFAFAYSHGDEWNRGTFANFFDIAEHPTKMVTLPAAAALFERGDVPDDRPADRGSVHHGGLHRSDPEIQRRADRGPPRRGPGGRFQRARGTAARARCPTFRARAQARRGKPDFQRHRRAFLGAGGGGCAGLREGGGAAQQSADRRNGRDRLQPGRLASRSHPPKPCKAGRPSR